MVLRPGWNLLCALMCFCVALEVRAESPVGVFEKAARHYQACEWQSAVEQFGQFLVSGHHQEPRSSLARFYRGESLIQLQQYSAAITVFREFLQLAPPDDANRPRALFQIGIAASASDDLSLAQKSLRECLERNHSDHRNSSLQTSATLRLADVCFRDKQFTEAAKLFERVTGTTADETHWEARYGWARALELSGDHDNARCQYESLADDSPATHADRAVLALGLMEYGQRRYEVSVAALKRLTKNFPNSRFLVESHYWQGRAHLELNRDKNDALRALASLRKAKDLTSIHAAHANYDSRLSDAITHYLDVATERLSQFDEQESRHANPSRPANAQHDSNVHTNGAGTFSRVPSTSVETANSEKMSPHLPGTTNSTPHSRPLFHDQWTQAACELESGQPHQAARTYLRIAAQRPGTIDSRRAQLSAAKCYEQAGRTSDAIELYSRLAGSGDPTIVEVATLRLSATK